MGLLFFIYCISVGAFSKDYKKKWNNYRPWNVLLHLKNEPNRTVQETNHTVQEANRTVQETNHTVQETNRTMQEAYRTVQETNRTVQEANRTVQKACRIIYANPTPKSYHTVQKAYKISRDLHYHCN